jgi:predicted nucleotidyltransferase component of viral defense system
LDLLAFKGGTSIRKLYAGNAGRFSIDFDFSLSSLDANRETIITELVDAVRHIQLGPFLYDVVERRGKWSVVYFQQIVEETLSLTSKIDISPPSWLLPVPKGWVPMPIHKQYGEPALPLLNVVRLEENIAEKIARLNRATPARDMYDLLWIMSNPSVAKQLNLDLIRRLAVLKIWTDSHGVHCGDVFWKPGHESSSFSSEHWLRDRSKKEFDIEDIGALAVSVPSASDLSDGVRRYYSFLADLDETEQIIALSREQDRAIVLRALAALPGERLNLSNLY